MSAVLHLPVLNTQAPYMLKEKPVESFAPAFTAVNGRASPPSPPTSTTAKAMSARQSPSHYPEQRQSENEYRSDISSTSPDTSSGESSPDSPKKRRRTESIEADHSPRSGMEAPQHHPLPPIDRAGQHEQRWTAEPQPRSGYQEMRDPRPMEPIHASMPPMASPHAPMGEMNGVEPANMVEMNRAGVQQIDAKKRKRQFANRTKTGCGTCRRRKKKCDEAKPECMLMTL